MLSLARVAAVHPEDNSVDLVMVDDGSRHPGVQVLAPFASTNSGLHDLPTPTTPPSGDQWSLTERTDRDMIAVCAMYGRRPLVLGFLFPQVCQMLFKDANRRVMRHASDVYSSIDDAGNFEMAWPNGLFFRVGSSPAHEDLTGKDVDGNWKITKNTGAQLHVHLEMPEGKAVVDIDPTGKVTVTNAADMDITTQGAMNLTAAGTMTLQAPDIAIKGATAVTGSALTHNGKDVGDDHTHGGVQSGVSNTAGPN